jgi:hypothetical protein
LLGTVAGRHYSATFPAPGLSAVLFEAGNFIVPIACSGREAGNPGNLKRFDFNDGSTGGIVYNQWVLLEQRDEFGVREVVTGSHNTVVFARNQSVFAPFYVQVWERDDGKECPTPARPWLPEFRVAFGFQTFPSTRITGWSGSSSQSDWFSFLGITNENDLMGSWVFGDWTSFESIAPSVQLVGTHVRVRLSNTGVDRNNVPAF